MAMTRTQETELRYKKLVVMLQSQYYNETTVEWRDAVSQFVQWVKQQITLRKWEKSTWRQYRAALVYFFEEKKAQAAVDALLSIDTALCSKKRGYEKRGAALKKKSLSDNDLNTVIQALDKKKQWDRMIALWLVSAVSTGLRPSEWEYAQLEGTILVVKNGKNTNDRSNGDWRHLDLSDLPDSRLKAISVFIRDSKKYDFKTLYNGCRARLHTVAKQCWPKRKSLPTLYSGRHQFRANAVLNGLSKPEVAALMGHASDQTATIHYGRKAVGSIDSVMPRPLEEEVKQVRRRNKGWSSPKKAVPTII